MKSFFKEFVETKKKIDYKVERYLISKNDLTCTCFDALEKYLNQYTWVRHEDEKICFDFCYDNITLQQVAEINEMSYNTLRSLNSRVSTRLYNRFGYDFAEVILGDDTKKQQKLMTRCDASVDSYKVNDNYPLGVLRVMNEGELDVSELDKFKITREDYTILKFLADYDLNTISTRLEMLDINRLALILHILSKKKYFDARCKILQQIHFFQEGMTPEYYLKDIQSFAGSKKVVTDKK